MIKFKSTADLRKNLQSHGTFSTLQLIKSYIDNNKNAKNQVRYFLRICGNILLRVYFNYFCLNDQFNKKYFRLRLTDKVRSERPETDLRPT